MAAAAGAETLPSDERDMWLELMALSLNEISRKALEAMMNIEDFRARSVWAQEARREGKLEGKLEGELKGKLEGELSGLRHAVVDLCEVLGLELDEVRREKLGVLDLAALHALREHLKRARTWPD